jgi:hypothetical protein
MRTLMRPTDAGASQARRQEKHRICLLLDQFANAVDDCRLPRAHKILHPSGHQPACARRAVQADRWRQSLRDGLLPMSTCTMYTAFVCMVSPFGGVRP